MTSICPPQEAIGYAVLRDSCLIEMFTLPGFSSARTAMIAQACRDAIDRDHHFVELHTPAVDPMHELLVTAGGSWQRRLTADGEWMFKLLSPDKWLERLYPVLQQRTHEGELARPLEITFDVDGQIHQLTLTRRSVRLQPVKASNGAGLAAASHLRLARFSGPVDIQPEGIHGDRPRPTDNGHPGYHPGPGNTVSIPTLLAVAI